MIDKLLSRLANDLAARLVATGVVLLLPSAVTIAWLSAVFQGLLWGNEFAVVFWELLLYAVLPIFLVGFVVLYAIERWIIRNRARESLRWSGLRILLYMAAGVPEGFGTLVSMRWGLGSFPPALERFYFVETVVMSVVMGFLYTLVERTMAEIQKRESRLKQQIQDLRIEIDELKRREQVAEISGSDFFQDLQRKAARMRRKDQGE